MHPNSCTHRVAALDSIARYTAGSGSESDRECSANAVDGRRHVVRASSPPSCQSLSTPIPHPTPLPPTAPCLTDRSTDASPLSHRPTTSRQVDTNFPRAQLSSTLTPRSSASVRCMWWNPPQMSCTTGGCCSAGSSARVMTGSTHAATGLTASHDAEAARRVGAHDRGACDTVPEQVIVSTAVVATSPCRARRSGSGSSSDDADDGGGDPHETLFRAARHVNVTAGLDTVRREWMSRGRTAVSTRGGYPLPVSPLPPDRASSPIHSHDDGDVVVATAGVHDYGVRPSARRDALDTPGGDAMANAARPTPLVCRRRGAPFHLSVHALDEERATPHHAASVLCTPLSSAAIVSPRVVGTGAATAMHQRRRQLQRDNLTPCLSLTSPHSSPWRQVRSVLRDSVSSRLRCSFSGNIIFAPPASVERPGRCAADAEGADEGVNNDTREEDVVDFFGSLTRRQVCDARLRSSNPLPDLCDAESESEDELRCFRTPLSPCPSMTAPRFDVLAGTHAVSTPLSMATSFPRRLSMQRLVAPHAATMGVQQQRPSPHHCRQPVAHHPDTRTGRSAPQSLGPGTRSGGVGGVCGGHADVSMRHAPCVVTLTSRSSSSLPQGGNSPPCQEVATMLGQLGAVQDCDAERTTVVVPRPAHIAIAENSTKCTKATAQSWCRPTRRDSPVIGEAGQTHDLLGHLSAFHALGLPAQRPSTNVTTTPLSSRVGRLITDLDSAPLPNTLCDGDGSVDDDGGASLAELEAPSPAALLRPHFSYASLQGCRSHQEDNVILLPALQVSVAGATPRGTTSTVAGDAATTIKEAVQLCCFGVFDGHNGDVVSSLASQYFLEHFELAFGEHYTRRGALAAPPIAPCASQSSFHTTQPSQGARGASSQPICDARHRALSAALVQALLHLDVTIYDATRALQCAAGATACVMACYLPPTPGDVTAATSSSSLPCREGVSFLKLSIANLGDSRAVIGHIDTGTVLLETRDHRLSSYPTERSRIAQCGGVVELDRIEGSLDVTRGLGDYRLKQPPCTWWLGQPCPREGAPDDRDPAHRASAEGADVTVSREGTAVRPGNIIGNVADVYEWEVRRDEFLLIASDGLWDRMSSAEAVAFVAAYLRHHDEADEVPNAVTPTKAAVIEAGASPCAPRELAQSPHSTSMWSSLPRTPPRSDAVVSPPGPAKERSEQSIDPSAQEVARSFRSPCSPSPSAYGVAFSVAASPSSSTCSVDTPRQTLLRRAVNHLTDHVLHRLGSRDNVTAVLVTFAPPSIETVSKPG